MRVRWLGLLFVVGCRTPSGVDERAEALLADYRSRPSSALAEGDRQEWASGQYTVHVFREGERRWLERVGLGITGDGRVRVSLDRLGVGQQLRVNATLSGPWRPPLPLEAVLTDAWVREAEHPEVHFSPTVPAWVTQALARALERPASKGSADLTSPAGRFPGCLGGVHPAVPLSGVVYMERAGLVRELVEFGDDGSGALY